MIKNLIVKNYRSLFDVNIDFEEDINAFVGENDSGKTSLINSFKIIFEDKVPEPDEFSYGKNDIHIELEVADPDYGAIRLIKDFTKRVEENRELVEQKSTIVLLASSLQKIKDEIESDYFKELDPEIQKNKLFACAKILGIATRSNSNTERLESQILDNIGNCSQNKIIESSFPDYSSYFLDGKHFENVEGFFQETFFKSKKKSIWNEKTDDGKSILELISTNLNEYADTLSGEIEKAGIKSKVQNYLPGLSKISINASFEPRDANIEVKVQLFEGDTEISLKNKGDGTKRRITMALLEYKRSNEDIPEFYVFDEPDTHLHVKAQLELLEIMRNFVEDEKQVILTTHSPFLMNSLKPRQIKLLHLENRETKIQNIQREEQVEKTLQDIGIMNTDLFFSKTLVIVEGDTEKEFIPIIYEKIYGKNLHSNLIKIINSESITDVPRTARIMEQFIKPKSIFILIDNDGDEATLELIEKLKIPDRNVFKVGEKEFEDAFTSTVIYNSWKCYVEDKNKVTDETSWNIEKIEKLKCDCQINELKFSKEIKSLNRNCIKMTKPIFGRALADYCDKEQLPKIIVEFLESINKS